MRTTFKIVIAALILISLSFTLKAQYCITNLYQVGCNVSSVNYKIDSLIIGSINLPSTPCTTSGNQLGYSDLTSMSTYLFTGNTYTLSYVINSQDITNNVKVWIDYNNDYNFDNTTELINQQNNVIPGKYTQSITIPTTAIQGVHRLRIRLVSFTSFIGACDQANIGEILDFNVNVVTKKDIAVDSINMPTNTASTAMVISPAITIHNLSDTILTTVPVRYRITGGSVISNTYTGSLAPGASAIYNFTTGFTVPSTNFNICAWTALTGDVNTNNDTICKSVTVNSNVINDVGVYAITTPGASLTAGSVITPYVTIKNYGNSSLANIPISYSVNNVVMGTGTYLGTLLPGGTGAFTFTGQTFIVPNSNFIFKAFTSLGIDTINKTNDTLSKTVVSNPITRDAGVYSIATPGATTIAGSVLYPTVYIRNYGNVAISGVPVTCRLNNVVVDTGTYTGTISAGGAVSYTLASSFTVPGSNFYFCAYTSLTGDTAAANDTTCKSVTLVITTLAHDVLVSKIVTPSDTVPSNTTQTISVWIKNKGTSTETSIPVFYQRGSTIPVTETWTGTLLPNDSTLFTFNTTFVNPSGLTYNFSAWTKMTTDLNFNNDSSYKTVYLCYLPQNPSGLTCTSPSGGHTINFAIGATATQTLNFYIHSIINANSYVWSYSGSGATISGNDTAVSVIFVPGALSGSLAVKGQNNCGVGASSPNFTITVNNNSTIGIEENNANTKANIYPNPAHNKLNIDCSFISKGTAKFSIYNIQGACLYNEETIVNATNYNKLIDISHFKAGIYYLKIETNQGNSYNKFIVE